jgi:hypothetical protein
MHRATLLMVLLLAVSLGAPAQAALSRTVVLATDPAGDQAIVGPQVVNPAAPPPNYRNVDVTAVLASQATDLGNPTSFSFFVNFSAPPTARQSVVFQFDLAKGPDSAAGSTASGAAKSITVTGTTVTGADGATASGQGSQLVLTVPYRSIGASAGDVLENVVVTATDQDGGPTGGGPLPDNVPADDSSASDRAPDGGGGAPFTLQPPPFRSNLTATVAGGEVHEANGTRAFAGPSATTRDGNATVRFDVRVANHARTADTVHLTAPASLRLQATLPDPVAIAAGAEATLSVTVQLRGAPPGTLAPAFQVQGLQGGPVAPATPATIVVLPPPPPGHRAIPAALGFLTPVVTGIGLDGALGDYAELAFLLFLVLMAVALVFLALFLVQTPWLRIAVEPRRALAVPGGVAEFRVRLDKARRGVAAAKAVLRRAPWASAFRFRGGPPPEGVVGTVRLDPANPAEGVLRVEVPPGTPSLERESFEFDIIPLDAEGAEMPRHRARSHVSVQALQPATSDPKVPKARDIRLAGVRHDPPDPLPGGTVTTTATIHNDGNAPAALRVVLLVDGKAVVEERIEVAARTTREAGLPWTAGAGKNQVKVQVFLA